MKLKKNNKTYKIKVTERSDSNSNSKSSVKQMRQQLSTLGEGLTGSSKKNWKTWSITQMIPIYQNYIFQSWMNYKIARL